MGLIMCMDVFIDNMITFILWSTLSTCSISSNLALFFKIIILFVLFYGTYHAYTNTLVLGIIDLMKLMLNSMIINMKF